MTTTDLAEPSDEGPVPGPLSLIFFRHAKSNWDADYGDDDRLRPLSARGRTAARIMGRFLATARQLPDLAVTSPAVRAQQTLELAMNAGDWRCPVLVRPSLYGDRAALLDEVRRVGSEIRTLVVVGHEPACSDAVRFLSGAEVRFPTAGMLRLDLQIGSWSDVDAGAGRIEWLVTPRLVGGR